MSGKPPDESGKKPFRVEQQEGVTILHFFPRDVPIFCDINASEELWDFISEHEMSPGRKMYSSNS